MGAFRIEIKQADKKQRMEGFGASGAWWAQHTGSWQESELARLLELFYDPHKGIGMTIYRHNIGAGDGEEIEDAWRRAESVEVAEGQYDWSRDAQALAVMKMAVEKGAKQIVAFANSPTPRMTISGMTSGHQEGKSNFRAGMEEQFAQYLIDVVKHLIEVEGLPVEWISPINEPMWLWNAENGQEGCHYTPEECLLVYRALDRKLQEQGLPVRISAIEAGEWTSARMYYYKLAEDKELMSRLGNIAVHSYVPHVSNPVYKEEFTELIRREQPNLSIWMSEWTEMEGGADYGMETALNLANLVHEDITIGGVTSWQYWIAVSKYDFRDGLVYVDEAEGRIKETKRLWAFGNYTKFIRPGDVRNEAYSDHSELKVAAFTDNGGERVTLVVVNNSKENVTSGIDIGTDGEGTSTEIYETSADSDLERVFTGATPRVWTFKAESVTTLVVKG
ncbi:glycoside hydrolase [Paenibacillus sp. CF384]|uniref:glycoside hydrolase family 30 protein n=1 Tax=Paenibacillus sp. CF384 TaxID=1884382 RepID=UPI00089C9AE8|nr:glycoside hydrolase [Paenibacillus sp. CF384]SDW76222.1 O-Glycosyl hydrolase [Paenibacillus sp. CF384]